MDFWSSPCFPTGQLYFRFGHIGIFYVQNYIFIEIEKGAWLPEITRELKRAGSFF